MEKTELRKIGGARLAALSKQTDLKKSKEASLYQALFASSLWQNAKSVGVTRATEIEAATNAIFLQGFTEKKQLAVPKTLPERQMAFFEVKETTTYQKTAFGVEEPESHLCVAPADIDLLIVPGLVFSRSGYRIGFGGGYYDRYLKNFANQTVSLVFQEQLCDDWEIEKFDVPIDKLIIDEVENE